MFLPYFEQMYRNEDKGNKILYKKIEAGQGTIETETHGSKVNTKILERLFYLLF